MSSCADINNCGTALLITEIVVPALMSTNNKNKSQYRNAKYLFEVI